MRREDREIGSRFSILNGTRLMVTKAVNVCDGCYFKNNRRIHCNDESEWLGSCAGVNRDDGTSVIFTEVRSSEEFTNNNFIHISSVSKIICTSDLCIYFNECGKVKNCLLGRIIEYDSKNNHR